MYGERILKGGGMDKLNIGQAVKFKQGTTGALLYPGMKLVVESVELAPLAYRLQEFAAAATRPILAFPNELELILPDVINTGISSGVGNWPESLALSSSPVIISRIEPGAELAITATACLPEHTDSSESSAFSTAGDATSSVF